MCLDEREQVQHYVTMIGQLQWLVTLGRFDIHAQITTMIQVCSKELTSRKATKDLWLCPEDQPLSN